MTTLDRRIGVADAVVIGLGAMLGAGVFVSVAPAAEAAGPALLVGLVLAAAVAWCNATSAAALAAQHPVAGGTYAYGRARLSPTWGFVAGWAFLVGKTASCAAIAQTLAAYAAPGAQTTVALLAVAVVAAVDYRGITRTVAVTRVLVAVVLLVLTAAVVAMLLRDGADADRLTTGADWSGVGTAAAVLFFAFAGYARIATLGEEVREPRRTIPRAIPLALGVVVAVYAVVAVAALIAVGAPALAGTDAPLVVAAGEGMAPVVRAGAAVATAGVLLSVLAGVGRTTFAMARGGDLPRVLDVVHPRFRTPHRADVAAAVVAAGLVLGTDTRAAIGLSAFTVLVYYAVTNAAALRLEPAERRWPRWLATGGLVGCIALALSVPGRSLLLGASLLLAGVAGRWVASRA